ncbi:MAG: hypothetical protein COB76_03645 [Alphaproteobacteria bacterium]|nr:MAG: hypothetical protein COB76_03645 [Alphaproteobacteria bacterium]
MLAQIKNMASLLDSQKIEYVIWKSLENFKRQLEGKEDIDILFRDENRHDVFSFLSKNGFILDITSADTHGGDLYIFRGYDNETHRFFTFHCHFGLFSGSKKYKEYRIPLEDLCFSSRIKKDDFWVLDDIMFFVTRFIVNAIREKPNDPILDDLCARFSGKINDIEEVDICKKIFAPLGMKKSVDKFMASSHEGKIGIQNKIVSNLNNLNPIDLRILNLDKVKKNRRSNVINRCAVRVGLKRNKLGYGCGIILAGHDGAGKSSSMENLSTILRKLGPIKKIYLGRQGWVFLNEWIDKGRALRGVGFLLRSIWPVTSSLEIITRYAIGKTFEKIGYIVIYDRSLYDVLMKWSGRKIAGARLSCWMTRMVLKRKDERSLFVYLLCSSEAVQKRKGKHTDEEVNKLQQVYENVLPSSYQKIDTTDLSPKDTHNEIVNLFLEKQKKVCECFL